MLCNAKRRSVSDTALSLALMAWSIRPQHTPITAMMRIPQAETNRKHQTPTLIQAYLLYIISHIRHVCTMPLRQ